MSKPIFRSIAVAVVGLTTLIVSSLSAQEGPAASKSEARPAPRTYNPARRVPPYFGQIGLSPEQREKIYEIREKHQSRIADLKRQIEEAGSQEMTACESVLTDAQRSLLNQRRAARKGRAGTAPAAGNPDQE